MFEIGSIAGGDKDEKEFITYDMGVQVSYSLDTQEASQDSVWQTCEVR